MAGSEKACPRCDCLPSRDDYHVHTFDKSLPLGEKKKKKNTDDGARRDEDDIYVHGFALALGVEIAVEVPGSSCLVSTLAIER